MSIGIWQIAIVVILVVLLFGRGKISSLPVLEDDTKNIIKYVEQSNIKKKKKFNFWKLLESNE